MPQRKDRVIIDTNLWISFLLSKKFDKLDYLISKDSIILIFSETLLDEFINVATRPKFKKYFSSEDLNNLLISIEKKALFINVESEIKICRDPKDDFLLSLAKDSKATHLLTGDKDLLDLSTFEGTMILTITDYLVNS